MDTLWFEQHPSKTYLLGIGLALGLCMFAGFMYGLTSPIVDEEVIDTVSNVIWYTVMIPVSILVIKLKNRSMWWLLLAGLLSPLWLGDEGKYSKYQADIQEKEERLHIAESTRIQELEAEVEQLKLNKDKN